MMPIRSAATVIALGALVVLGTGATASHAQAKDVLAIDLAGEPSSLDPQGQWNPDSYYVYRNVFDNLVTRDDAGKIVPQVAIAWKYASDTEITFDLRDDIKFHDGRLLTPEDVVFTIQRITDKTFASPQLGQFNKIVKAEAVGPHTVRLTTDGAYPALLAQLVKLSIVPKHIVEAVGNDAFNLHPVGSGPYRFDGWQRGVQVKLQRNPDYWGTKGQFDRVVFRAVPDPATRVADLQAGTADLAVGLDADLAAQLKSSARVKPLTVLTERVAYVKLNPARPPFDDPRLRAAVAHAIDKLAIVNGLLGGYDKPVSELLTPAHFGWVDGINGLPFDPAAAKKLVAAAGDKAKVKIAFATAPAFDARVVQAIQQMLADIGFDIELDMNDMPTYLKRAQAEPGVQPQLTFGRWSCACQDADGVLFPLLDSGSAWSALRDESVDANLEHARATLDDKERLAAYGKVHDYVAREVPFVPLYQSAIIYGAAKPLQWAPTPNESLFVNRMSWAE
jgi:peptide/nickel transport system substrate-binding protein